MGLLIRQVVSVPQVERISRDQPELLAHFVHTDGTENLSNVNARKHTRNHSHLTVVVHLAIGHARVKLLPDAIWPRIDVPQVVEHAAVDGHVGHPGSHARAVGSARAAGTNLSRSPRHEPCADVCTCTGPSFKLIRINSHVATGRCNSHVRRARRTGFKVFGWFKQFTIHLGDLPLGDLPLGLDVMVDSGGWLPLQYLVFTFQLARELIIKPLNRALFALSPSKCLLNLDLHAIAANLTVVPGVAQTPLERNTATASGSVPVSDEIVTRKSKSPSLQYLSRRGRCKRNVSTINNNCLGTNGGRNDIFLKGGAATHDKFPVPSTLRSHSIVSRANNSGGSANERVSGHPRNPKEHSIRPFRVKLVEVSSMSSFAPENSLTKARYGRFHAMAGDILEHSTPVRLNRNSAKQRAGPPGHPLENRVLLVDLGPDLALKVTLKRPELALPGANGLLDRAIAFAFPYRNIERHCRLRSLGRDQPAQLLQLWSSIIFHRNLNSLISKFVYDHKHVLNNPLPDRLVRNCNSINRLSIIIVKN